MEFATRAVHAGLDPDPSFGSIIPAIHQTSTYVQPAVGTSVGDYDYARTANPTRTALEVALGELEGGRAIAFSSGMAAVHAVITHVCSAGDHIVLPHDLYGGSFRLVDRVLSRWGARYDLVDQTDLHAVERAVNDDTRLIWVETPTNPMLNLVDIGAIVQRRRGALVAVDNTFATPANQRPLELGADLVVHSTTKYLGGHSDVVGGVAIARDDALVDGLRFVQNAVGAVPGPLDCFLVHRGLRTLALRMAAHAENARAVSAALRRDARRARGSLARLLRDGQLPASRCARDCPAHPPVLPGRVARWRGVADRGSAGHDPSDRRGVGRSRPRRRGPSLLWHRGARRPHRRPGRRHHERVAGSRRSEPGGTHQELQRRTAGEERHDDLRAHAPAPVQDPLAGWRRGQPQPHAPRAPDASGRRSGSSGTARRPSGGWRAA